MSGLSEIVAETKPKCPHCRKKIDLRDFAHTIFQRILMRCEAGEEVQVADFGTFYVKMTRSRAIKSFDGSPVRTAAKRYLKLRAHNKHVLSILNAGAMPPPPPEKLESPSFSIEEKPDASRTKPARKRQRRRARAGDK